jgi:hypothetical protein
MLMIVSILEFQRMIEEHPPLVIKPIVNRFILSNLVSLIEYI